MSVRRAVALVTACVLAVPAPAALAARCPKTSLADIEDEVMCLVCGVPLALADAPQAQRERALIGRLVRRCDSKQQVKAELVAQYGPQVLASPDASGFRLTAYLVPAFLALSTGLGLWVGAARWRRRAPRGPSPPAAAAAPPDAIEAARLETELDHYRGL